MTVYPNDLLTVQVTTLQPSKAPKDQHRRGRLFPRDFNSDGDVRIGRVPHGQAARNY